MTRTRSGPPCRGSSQAREQPCEHPFRQAHRVTGQGGEQQLGRVGGQRQRRTEQSPLRPEEVAHQGGVDPGLGGDRAHGDGLVALGQEAAPGDVEHLGAGLRPSRPATAPAGPVGGGSATRRFYSSWLKSSGRPANLQFIDRRIPSGGSHDHHRAPGRGAPLGPGSDLPGPGDRRLGRRLAQRRDPLDRPRHPRHPDPAVLGDRRLRPGLRRPAPAGRCDRRPVRPAPGPARRPDDLRRRVRGRHDGHRPRLADRDARPAGGRCRAGHAGHPVHHHEHVPARAARSRRRRLGRRGRRQRHPRPARLGCPARGLVLAGGVRAERRPRRGRDRRHPARDPGDR